MEDLARELGAVFLPSYTPNVTYGESSRKDLDLMKADADMVAVLPFFPPADEEEVTTTTTTEYLQQHFPGLRLRLTLGSRGHWLT